MQIPDQCNILHLYQDVIPIKINTRCFMINQNTFRVVTINVREEIDHIICLHILPNNTVVSNLVNVLSTYSIIYCEQYNNCSLVMRNSEIPNLCALNVNTGRSNFTIVSSQEISKQNSISQVNSRIILNQQGTQRMYSRINQIKQVRKYTPSSTIPPGSIFRNVSYNGISTYVISTHYQQNTSQIIRTNGLYFPQNDLHIKQIAGIVQWNLFKTSFDGKFALIGKKLYKEQVLVTNDVRYEIAIFHSLKSILIFSMKNKITVWDLELNTSSIIQLQIDDIYGMQLFGDCIIALGKNVIINIQKQSFTYIYYQQGGIPHQ